MKVLFALLTASLAVAPCGAASVKVKVTDTHGRPVEDAVVFVRAVPGKKSPPPKESYIMDQVEQVFVPHVLPIVVGGSVRFPNKDAIHHHLYSFSEARKFELPLYKGQPSEPVRFDKAGAVKLGCNIHDWMNGVILVLSNPYFAKTGKDGSAELDWPAGKSVELEVFHERLRGEPAATRRAVAPGSAGPQEWALDLKTDFRKKKPDVKY